MAEGRNAPATALADEPAAMEQQDRSQNLRDLAVVAASSKTFIAGAAILLFWILVALFWGAVVPYGPQALDPTASLAPPSAEHWFGTDNLGRDVFSRVLAGATSVLTVAPLGTA
ncbi:MAG: ABC transporter permease, partial [Actinomycetota bacterium]|nr:ABC transporter permease [Actinomycetota bacterium]